MPVLAPDALAAPVLVDQYPAKVTKPDGTMVNKCRAVITPDLLCVYAHIGRRVETIIAVAQTAAAPSLGVWLVTTADGEYQIASGSGCGCGSPLRSMMTPYAVFFNVEPWAV